MARAATHTVRDSVQGFLCTLQIQVAAGTWRCVGATALGGSHRNCKAWTVSAGSGGGTKLQGASWPQFHAHTPEKSPPPTHSHPPHRLPQPPCTDHPQCACRSQSQLQIYMYTWIPRACKVDCFPQFTCEIISDFSSHEWLLVRHTHTHTHTLIHSRSRIRTANTDLKHYFRAETLSPTDAPRYGLRAASGHSHPGPDLPAHRLALHLPRARSASSSPLFMVPCPGLAWPQCFLERVCVHKLGCF